MAQEGAGSEYITKAEAARQLGVTTRTVDRWATEGRLQWYALGKRGRRFKREELGAALVVMEPGAGIWEWQRLEPIRLREGGRLATEWHWKEEQHASEEV